MKKLTRLLILASLVVATLIIFSSCNKECEHDWKKATCTKPKTCWNCDETTGEPKGHDFIEATCTEPKKCLNCDKTEGKALGHKKGDWKIDTRGIGKLHCNVCNEVINIKYGFVDNIYTSNDIPNELMNNEFKNIIGLFSKSFSETGLDISNAITYDGENYIFYLDNLEFLGDKCEKGSNFTPRIIYNQDAINNNGYPCKMFFAFANPLKSNGYQETVKMVEDIARVLDISDDGLIDNDYSSSSALAIGKYATFTFTNLNLELTVSNTDGTVDINIVPID